MARHLRQRRHCPGSRRRLRVEAWLAAVILAATSWAGALSGTASAAPATDPTTTLVPACTDPVFPNSHTYDRLCLNYSIPGVGSLTVSPATVSADIISGAVEFQNFTFVPGETLCNGDPYAGAQTCVLVYTWSYGVGEVSMSSYVSPAPLGEGDLSSGCVHEVTCQLRLHNGDSFGTALYPGLWLAGFAQAETFVNGVGTAVYQLAAPFQIAGGPTPPPNVPVAASFTTAPDTATPGRISFDASGSTPSTGATISSYVWDFGDGSAVVTTATPTTSHDYATGGPHTVTLTVTDSGSQSATYSRTLNFPTAAFSVAQDLANPKAITFDASASHGSDGATIASYTWDFGDSTTPVITQTPTTSHTYASGGTKQVTLTVTDSARQASPPVTKAVIVAAFEVNSTGDAPATDTSKPNCDTGATVTTGTASVPECTLRAAIQAANVAGGGNITFTLPVGESVISVASALPALTAAGVTVDATTNPTGSIRLDGALVPNNTSTGIGLRLSGGADTVRGFRFFGWATAILIDSAAGGDIVAGNRIGIADDDGAPSDNVVTGVDVENSPHNTIGGNSSTDANVISFVNLAVLIRGAGAAGNSVAGNLLGTTADGARYAGDVEGIVVIDASGTVIGGVTSTPGSAPGNVIVSRAKPSFGPAPTSYGIFAGGLTTAVTGTVIEGNTVGLLAHGSELVPSTVDASFAGGIAVGGRSSGTIIGGTAPGAGNVIAGSSAADIEVTGTLTSGTQVLGNRIGTNAAGTAPMQHGGAAGVIVAAAHTTTIGTAGAGGNLISGYASHAAVTTQTDALPVMSGTATFPGTSDATTTTMSTLISGNIIGPMADGKTVSTATVQGTGISLGGIGDTAGPNNLIAWNTVGIAISGSNETVVGNLIGTDSTGLASLPNGEGIDVTGPGATIGVPGAKANTISGNVIGILTAAPVTVQNNLLGTTDLGNAAITDTYPDLSTLPDALVAPLAAANLTQTYLFESTSTAPGTVIGGTQPGFGNVVAGNPHGSGLILGARTVVQGNRIGVGADGATPIGNAGDGVLVAGGNGTLIGAAPTDPASAAVAGANIIANNTADGVDVASPSQQTAVASNSIYRNAQHGIELHTSGLAVPQVELATQNGSGATALTLATGSAVAGSLLQVFASTDCGAGNEGQGRTLLGGATVTGADVTITVALQAAATMITATLTTPAGTSSFATCQPVLTAGPATLTPATLQPGQSATATGAGFAPGEQVDATAHTTPVDLGRFTADATGTVTVHFTLPIDFPTGAHVLVLTGLSSGHVDAVAFAVTAPTAIEPTTASSTRGSSEVLANTGEASNPNLLLGALLALTFGSGLCLATRRRDRLRGGAGRAEPRRSQRTT
jgi:CSLREA domain-containing protein/LPXTG-motif cell wall-anchored protein